MLYNIRHVTRFIYEASITESVMEAAAAERGPAALRALLAQHHARVVRMYQDQDGNIVHHFNIPGRLSRLSIVADALVDCAPAAPLPATLGANAWDRLDAATSSGAFWEMLNPSPFARPARGLEAFAAELLLARDDDPIGTLRRICRELFTRLTYSPQSTRVDSPIDVALEARRGVCQDFTHIMIALVRQLGIPCRYVSGYLFHEADPAVRSPEGATHAWVEAWLPGLNWVGFDPTNNLPADARHIRVAVGRDYADVPPTRGVFKGLSAVRSELSVAVRVGTAAPGALDQDAPMMPWVSREVTAPAPRADAAHQQQ